MTAGLGLWHLLLHSTKIACWQFSKSRLLLLASPKSSLILYEGLARWKPLGFRDYCWYYKAVHCWLKILQEKNPLFILNHGASSTKQGNLYIAKNRDEFQNARTRTIPRPECCSAYLKNSNVIDIHNHMCQKLLRLEKH